MFVTHEFTINDSHTLSKVERKLNDDEIETQKLFIEQKIIKASKYDLKTGVDRPLQYNSPR